MTWACPRLECSGFTFKFKMLVVSLGRRAYELVWRWSSVGFEIFARGSCGRCLLQCLHLQNVKWTSLSIFSLSRTTSQPSPWTWTLIGGKHGDASLSLGFWSRLYKSRRKIIRFDMITSGTSRHKPPNVNSVVIVREAQKSCWAEGDRELGAFRRNQKPL